MPQLHSDQVVERYTALSLLGQGGMAMVYRVRHNQLDTEHALKILTMTHPGIRERLLQEGKVQAALRHPNVVAVTDVLDVDGAPGLLMEYVAGRSMEDWLLAHRPSLDEVEALFRGIVAAVQAAHDKGLIHRDLKPANVMLAREGDTLVPKVTDFGLAKLIADEVEARHRTRTGMAMGTPAYMSPEQIRDASSTDRRTDIFALGCILFEMTTGRPAFDGPDIVSIFHAVTTGDYPRSLVEDLPRRFVDTITGCLHLDRERRIQDCDELLRSLSGEQVGAPPADATWQGSLADDLLDSDGEREEEELVAWPPPDGVQFSIEAIDAAAAPEGHALPPPETLLPPSQMTMATLERPPTVDEATRILEEQGPTLAPAPDAGHTLVPSTGRGQWLNLFIGMVTVVMLGVVIWLVAGRPPVVERVVQWAQPEPPEAPVAAAETPTGRRAPPRDQPAIQIGPSYTVDGPAPGGSVPDDSPDEAAPEPVPEPSETVDANVTVVDDPEDLPEDDDSINVALMTTEELAQLPEDKLPPGMGVVTVTGDPAEVWLHSNQGRIEPGLVLAGDYRVQASFEGGEPVGAGTVHVTAGNKVVLRCSALFQTCVQ